MTNKEYIEKNDISFSEAMKMWNNKTTCINEWLNQEFGHRFKVGDFVRKSISDKHGVANSYVGVVIDVKDWVYIKVLTRGGQFVARSRYSDIDREYYKTDPLVWKMSDESTFEKLF